ncbi:ATP-binding protein [Galbibacter sp. EGI 63066]|uniref:ATP-binding protein n=1 Tax=Galbibacter sp. EGI 63066 TaxID=2993559 RepID=UPI002248AE4D|nr:ATP-binding protein [Galbibacter sp. EGI 63066]MCX2679019.1 ATP-binding protein [Galbibacter sp. EGI 63066]
MEFKVGPDIIKSYKRLSYSPWHAIAELVDNSTQSYFNNEEELKAKFEANDEKLQVAVVYDKASDILRVSDNSIGMTGDELEDALHIGKTTDRTSGRSKYGLGLKTSACWLGNKWSVRTKKLGESVEHFIKVDVEEVANGNNTLEHIETDGKSVDESYTIVEVTDLNRQFHGRTLGKIKNYLSSMYRIDIREGRLELEWQGESLTWQEPEFLSDREGNFYYKSFDFVVDEDTDDPKTVTGWVGILNSGSRANAGFSILQSSRVIKGWPKAWRPSTIYGQEEGSNDLINQRLIGEIHLDGLEVSHTKDDIQWFGSQEEEVENKLYDACKDYRDIAKIPRKALDDGRGPTQAETDVAIDELKKELFSPEMVDKISLTVVPNDEEVDAQIHAITNTIEERAEPEIEGEIGGIFVKVYIDAEMSPNDPYVLVEAAQSDEVIIIVNASHPHWNQVTGDHGTLNYLRHCTYDGVAEHMARFKKGTVNPNTIKLLKDQLLRVAFNIEQNIDGE